MCRQKNYFYKFALTVKLKHIPIIRLCDWTRVLAEGHKHVVTPVYKPRTAKVRKFLFHVTASQHLQESP